MKEKGKLIESPTNEQEQIAILLVALDEASTALFYCTNLAMNAWRDPKNLEPVCNRIVDYARQGRLDADTTTKKVRVWRESQLREVSQHTEPAPKMCEFCGQVENPGVCCEDSTEMIVVEEHPDPSKG